MDRRWSINFSFILSISLVVLLMFNLTSALSFAEEASSNEEPQNSQEAKSLEELKEESSVAIQTIDESEFTSANVTAENADVVRDNLTNAQRALDAYESAGGSETDFDLTKYNKLLEAYGSYISNLQETNSAVTVAEVKQFMNEKLPDSVFRSALLANFETYYSGTDWDDDSAVVKNNSDVVTQYPSTAPETFTSASDVLSWWGGDLTLPSNCVTIDGVQYLGKDYYRTGNNEKNPPTITTTSQDANFQEFFGSVYGDSSAIIYVDINALSMNRITIFGLNWDSSTETGIPSFAHTMQLSSKMEQPLRSEPLTFLRDRVNNISLRIKTGLTEHVSASEVEAFGPNSTNANFTSKGSSAYNISLNDDGWTLTPTGNSVVYSDDDSGSSTGSDRDKGLNLYLRPGIWQDSNNTFYLYYCDSDYRGVVRHLKSISTTYGYCVPTKCISTLDADYEAQLYGGFTFNKTSSITTTMGLAGAKYVVQNTEGKYLRVGGDNSASEFVDTLNLASQFETDENGSFTVKNVPLGNVLDAGSNGKITCEYTVTEIQAPAGYELDSTPSIVTVTGDASGIATTFDGGEGEEVEVTADSNITYEPDFAAGTLSASDAKTTTDSSHDCYIANSSDKGDGILGSNVNYAKYSVLDSYENNYSTVVSPTFSLVDLNGVTVITASSLDELTTKINEELIGNNAMTKSTDCYTIKANTSIIYYDNESVATSSVEYSGGAQTHYDTPLPVNINLKADKKLLGANLQEGQFKFTLTPKQTVQGDPISASGISATNDTNGNIEFSNLSYARPGTYTYTLKETDESPDNPEIIYDTDERTVTVVVTESADGLHVTVNADGDYTAADSNEVTYSSSGQNVIKVYADASTNATFANYAAIDLRGTKVWNDYQDLLGYRPDYASGQTVQLTVFANGERLDPQPAVTWSYTNDAQGSWSYVIKRLPKVDENNNLITYSVEETKVNNYDEPEKTHVETDENGDFITDFKNSLVVGDLQIEKKNEAEGSLQNKYFEFTVTFGKPNGGAYTGATYTLPAGTITSLNSNGEPQIVLSEDTTYSYTGPFKVYLKGDASVQIKNILEGASYVVSETTASAFNEVADRSGVISGNTVMHETITNTPVTTALQFEKAVESVTGKNSDDEFGFTIKVGEDESSLENFAGNYVVSGDGIEGTEHTIGTGANAVTVKGELRSTADGRVKIKAGQVVTFEAQYADDYYYEVTEDGMDPYTILPPSGSVKGSTSSLSLEHFVNVKKVPEPAEVLIDVEKLIDAPAWADLSKEGYEFVLSGSQIPTKATATLATSSGSFMYDTDSKMWSSSPSGTFMSYNLAYDYKNIKSLAKSGEDGKAQFERFNIAKEGNYTFTVNEVVPDDVPAYIKYDTREVTVNVDVTLDASTNKLVSSVTYSGGATGNADDGNLSRAFSNVLISPTSVSVPIKITKHMTEKAYSAGDFLFTRRDVSSISGVDNVRSETVTNLRGSDEEGNSTIDFSNVELTAPGTYVFEITENKGSDACIEYSSEKITITVVVDWLKSESQNELEVESVTYSNSLGNEKDVITNRRVEPSLLAKTGTSAIPVLIFAQIAVAVGIAVAYFRKRRQN